MELIVLIALGAGAAYLYSKSKAAPATGQPTGTKAVGAASDIPPIPGGAPK